MLISMNITPQGKREATAYGIQSWLHKGGHCKNPANKRQDTLNLEQYRALVHAFCNKQEDFKPELAKDLNAMEGFIAGRFTKFCNFVTHEYHAEG